MGEVKEVTEKNCVLLGCNNKAVAVCNNCGIPVCNMHAKRINNQIYLCVNCFEYTRKLKLRR